MFRPVIYVFAGATIGLGLLAAAFGADLSAIMTDFVVDATGEIAPLIWRLLGIWAIFTGLAAVLSASACELYLLSDADRARFAYTLLGRVCERPVQFSAIGFWLRHGVLIRLTIWRRKWMAGIHPPLVYQ